jgi:hypothetical protein
MLKRSVLMNYTVIIFLFWISKGHHLRGTLKLFSILNKIYQLQPNMSCDDKNGQEKAIVLHGIFYLVIS